MIQFNDTNKQVNITFVFNFIVLFCYFVVLK